MVGASERFKLNAKYAGKVGREQFRHFSAGRRKLAPIRTLRGL
jgi:hypothetical protein